MLRIRFKPKTSKFAAPLSGMASNSISSNAMAPNALAAAPAPPAAVASATPAASTTSTYSESPRRLRIVVGPTWVSFAETWHAVALARKSKDGYTHKAVSASGKTLYGKAAQKVLGPKAERPAKAAAKPKATKSGGGRDRVLTPGELARIKRENMAGLEKEIAEQKSGGWKAPPQTEESRAATIGMTVDEYRKAGGAGSASAPSPTPKSSPHVALAAALADKFFAGDKITAKDLWAAADEAYGGTKAEGKYGPSEAYDSMEAGLNAALIGKTDPKAGLADAEKQAAELGRIVSLLPTQTNRSGNKDSFQQFSTPPHYAFAAAWAANLQPGDVVLEPTGGTGCLAVHALNAGAMVYGNELDPVRADHLKALLGDDKVSMQDAEQISAILPGKGVPKPSAIVMNPPFSQTAGRMGDKKDLMVAAKHINEALNLLQPGGRLVAIVGRGMSPDKATYRGWFKKVEAEYNLRANVGVTGDEYKKYGTHFGTRVLVIDKEKPTGKAVITGDANSVQELMATLEGVRNDRPKPSGQPSGQQVGAQVPQGQGRSGADSAGESGLGASQDPDGLASGVQGGGGRVGAGEPGAGGKDAGGGLGSGAKPKSERKPRHAGGKSVGGKDGGGSGKSAAGQSGVQPANPGAVLRKPEKLGLAKVSHNPDDEPGFTGYDRLGRKWVDGKLVKKEEEPGKEREVAGDDLAMYENYKPALLHIDGAKEHNTPLVESAAMAAVLPPIPTYQPMLSPDLIEKGELSEAQLEAIVYAGQAHEKMLPDGARRGYFIGDGTGVGKGREIAGIIADNFNQDRKKAVWVSEKQNLYEDAIRDWKALGNDPALLIHYDQWKKKKVKPEDGIIFITYDTLKGRPTDKTKPTNLQEISKWLGDGFEGVIAFDEAHNMANAMTTKGARGDKNASKKALAGLDIQKALPNARVTYVSATGATEVSNLAYAERLGLWGKGTEFANREEFIMNMNAGGVAAMEAVAQSMKAMGMYGARGLSFKGVGYETLTHHLTDEQKFTYDQLSEGWLKVMGNIEAAVGFTGGSGNQKGQAMAQFWNAQQRFFNQVITSMQTPSVIKAMEADIAEGRAPVIQLVNTMDAALKRAYKEAEERGEEIVAEDLDVSPRDILVKYLKSSFPVDRMEDYEDENGTIRQRPVREQPEASFDDYVAGHGKVKGELSDADRSAMHVAWINTGKVVTDPQAEALRDEMLAMVHSSLPIPESPLDQIINHPTFGHEKIAEATGRQMRKIKKDKEDGTRGYEIEKRDSTAASAADAQAFQDGRKVALIFSAAGGTGRSYHADRGAKNQGQRVHYLLQPGWRADAAVQGFGRTNRTNQSSAPIYRLVQIEELKAQKRFISTIASRLDQLGALTKGQRSTGGGGLFKAADNLGSKEAKAALNQFLGDMEAGRDVPGLDYKDVMTQMGYLTPKDNEKGKPKEIDTDMDQFLNRMLILKPNMQGKVFEAFEKRLNDQIGQAIANNTLDAGVENFPAKSIQKVSDEVAFQDKETQAEARHLVTNVTRKVDKREWKKNTEGDKPVGYVKNKSSGQVWAVHNANDKTDDRGTVTQQYRLIGPAGKPQWKPRHELGRHQSHFEAVEEGAAKELWEKEHADLPSTEDAEEHFVTGAFLPIWKKIPGSDKPKVYRLKLADGSTTVGRHIPRNKIEDFMKNVGKTYVAKAHALPDLHAGLESGKTKKVTLGNGWSLKPSLVQNERRIELLGVSPMHWESLVKDGAVKERVAYDTRLFIPTGAAGVQVMERITKGHAVSGVEGDVPKSSRSESPKPPPAEKTNHADLASKINAAMDEHAPDSWKGHQAKEAAVLNAIYPVLNRDREATQAVFEILKNQSDHRVKEDHLRGVVKFSESRPCFRILVGGRVSSFAERKPDGVYKDKLGRRYRMQGGRRVPVLDAGGAKPMRAKATAQPQTKQARPAKAQVTQKPPSKRGWNASLSPEEKAAVNSYTGTGYISLNKKLRSEANVGQGKVGKTIAALDAAIAKSPPLAKSMTLYRGVPSKRFNDIKPGSIIADKAYISTSSREQEGYTFSSEGGALLVISAPKGTRAAVVDDVDTVKTKNESEYLLPRGTKFKVLRVHEPKKGKVKELRKLHTSLWQSLRSGKISDDAFKAEMVKVNSQIDKAGLAEQRRIYLEIIPDKHHASFSEVMYVDFAEWRSVPLTRKSKAGHTVKAVSDTGRVLYGKAALKVLVGSKAKEHGAAHRSEYERITAMRLKHGADAREEEPEEKKESAPAAPPRKVRTWGFNPDVMAKELSGDDLAELKRQVAGGSKEMEAVDKAIAKQGGGKKPAAAKLVVKDAGVGAKAKAKLKISVGRKKPAEKQAKTKAKPKLMNSAASKTKESKDDSDGPDIYGQILMDGPEEDAAPKRETKTPLPDTTKSTFVADDAARQIRNLFGANGAMIARGVESASSMEDKIHRLADMDTRFIDDVYNSNPGKLGHNEYLRTLGNIYSYLKEADSDPSPDVVRKKAIERTGHLIERTTALADTLDSLGHDDLAYFYRDVATDVMREVQKEAKSKIRKFNEPFRVERSEGRGGIKVILGSGRKLYGRAAAAFVQRQQTKQDTPKPGDIGIGRQVGKDLMKAGKAIAGAKDAVIAKLPAPVQKAVKAYQATASAPQAAASKAVQTMAEEYGWDKDTSEKIASTIGWMDWVLGKMSGGVLKYAPALSVSVLAVAGVVNPVAAYRSISRGVKAIAEKFYGSGEVAKHAEGHPMDEAERLAIAKALAKCVKRHGKKWGVFQAAFMAGMGHGLSPRNAIKAADAFMKTSKFAETDPYQVLTTKTGGMKIMFGNNRQPLYGAEAQQFLQNRNKPQQQEQPGTPRQPGAMEQQGGQQGGQQKPPQAAPGQQKPAQSQPASGQQPGQQQPTPNAPPGHGPIHEATHAVIHNLSKQAEVNGHHAVEELVNHKDWKGPKNPEEVKKALHKAYEHAEVTVNFSTLRSGAIASSPSLLNAYESGGRSKDYMATRTKQEDSVFGAGKHVPESDRPKYAAVNWQKNLYGAASMYGEASLVLNKKHLASRATMTSGNSFGHRDSSGVGTGEHPLNALARNAHALKAAGMEAPGHVGQGYTEMQIWGGMPINKDTVHEIRYPSLDAAKPGVDKMVEFAKKEGIPVKFFHEHDGSSVSYDAAVESSKKHMEAMSKKSGWFGSILKLFGL